MKTEENKTINDSYPAFPLAGYNGMSLRTYIATAALQGYVECFTVRYGFDSKKIAKYSVELADALIAELNKDNL